MKTNKLTYILVLIIFMSCNDDDTLISTPEEIQEPLIQLTFSDSPIDLQGIEASFVEDLPYYNYTDTTFDIFLPPSDSPTGLVIFIHGGGFTGGDKGFIYNENFDTEIIELLSNDIAVATINYRVIESGDTQGVLKCLNDSKRALQYIRYLHNELNIAKDRIVLFGSSAGASTAMWLATNDDFSDINNEDPVSHESTRVKGIALNATQSSLDIETRWLGNVFADFDKTLDDIINEFGEELVLNFYGVSSFDEYYTPEIVAYRAQVDMLALLSPDDPEIWVTNTGGHNNEPLTTGSFNHHPFHAKTIKEFADAAGVSNVATYGNPILYSDPSNEDYISFLMRKLNE
ncbi:MAG: alpha/beta hydrolase fold domain-containing protein [bacterium]